MKEQIGQNNIKHTPSAKVKEVNEDSGSVRFTLTEKAVDRHGEVVEPQGAKLENYLTNPIVLFGHGMGNQVPIGKLDTTTIHISDESIEADVIFDESGDDPFAKMIASKVKNGFLNAGSIGFKPLEISEEKGLDGQTGVTHTKWELMEFSIVPIPALPSALATREYEEYATMCKSLGFEMPNGEVKVVVKEEVVPEPTTADEHNEIFLEEEKAGAVLNSRNKQLINSAIENLEKAVESLKDVAGDSDATEVSDPEVVDTEKGDEMVAINEIRESLSNYNVRRELVGLRDSLN